VQHLHIGDRPVRSVEELLQRNDRHPNKNQLHKEEEQRVLGKLQKQVKTSPDAEIATEQFTAKLPARLRESANRTDKGAEGLLGEKRHDQESQEKHQCCWVNGVKVTCGQPGFEAYQRTDRQKALNPGRSGIIARLPCRFEVLYKETELDAQKETPAEEKPLDRQAPVTRFLPIDYCIHDALKILRIEYQGNDFGQKSQEYTVKIGE